MASALPFFAVASEDVGQTPCRECDLRRSAHHGGNRERR
jgi:hypothetical protein